MELIHAFSQERLAKCATNAPSGSYKVVAGTVVQWTSSSSTANLIADALGIRVKMYSDSIGVQTGDAQDSSRSTSYWVTAGALIAPDNVSAATAPYNMIAFATSAILSAATIFGLSNNLPAYVEVAYNPITGELRAYVNGIQAYRHPNVGAVPNPFINFAIAATVDRQYTIKDMYVARFEGNEQPYLRRWKSVTLDPVTNELGAGISMADGTVVSLGDAVKKATYTLPAGALGVVAQVTMTSPDGASDLSSTITDGTISKTVVSKDAPNVPTQTTPRVGHAANIGQLTPTANATTLTVSVKAVNRA